MEENFNYLTGLSEKAKNIIIKKVENGDKNIYHSIMAVLSARDKNGTFSNDLLEEKIVYKNNKKGRRNIDDLDTDTFDEIFKFTYNKYLLKRIEYKTGHSFVKSQNKHLIKAALIHTLKMRNVSYTEINKTIDVLNGILKNVSEYDLKNIYYDYVKNFYDKSDKK